MARVFMSVLGTTKYTPVSYKFGDAVSPTTPFVQEAYLTVHRDDWGEKDRIVFFLTEEARRKNWEDGGNFEIGLKKRLEELGLSSQIIPVPFKEGCSEEEINENFLTVVDQLQKGDKVVFDITHSFRSLPMLNLVALTYARVLKGIEVARIYYGAFEALEEECIAPVFDLTPYVALLDWSFAVEEFSRYGMARRLYELTRGRIDLVLKEARGRDEKANALKDLVNHLQGLSASIYTSRCKDLVKTKIGEVIPRCIDFPGYLPAFPPLLEVIREKVKGFLEKEPWERELSAVDWCVKHGLTQQGYTILRESIISELCRMFGFKDPLENKGDREFVSQLLSMVAQKKPEGSWEGALRERRSEALHLIDGGGDELRGLAFTFHKVSERRNDINHCGCRKDASKRETLMKNLKTLLQDARDRMDNLKGKWRA